MHGLEFLDCVTELILKAGLAFEIDFYRLPALAHV